MTLQIGKKKITFCNILRKNIDFFSFLCYTCVKGAFYEEGIRIKNRQTRI